VVDELARVVELDRSVRHEENPQAWFGSISIVERPCSATSIRSLLPAVRRSDKVP
jgi:hypothetical protein